MIGKSSKNRDLVLHAEGSGQLVEVDFDPTNAVRIQPMRHVQAFHDRCGERGDALPSKLEVSLSALWAMDNQRLRIVD